MTLIFYGRATRSRDYAFGNYWRGPHPSEGTMQFIRDRAKWAKPYAVERFKDHSSRFHGLKERIKQTVMQLTEARMPLYTEKFDKMDNRKHRRKQDESK